MFNKIVVIDDGKKMTEAGLNELKTLAREVVAYDDSPASPEEAISRIGDADCVTVSFRTQLRRDVIEACPNLKFIAMSCSLFDAASSNVDIIAAAERGIDVKGIFDYADEGVVEFIISSLVWLMHGFGEHKWQDYPTELTYQKIGIIGLGTVGSMLAGILQIFKADIYYYDRVRKPDWEEKGVRFLELDELLETVDILSLHVPRNSKILSAPEFERFGAGKILVNTSLGPMFPVEDIKNWLKLPNTYYICDMTGMGAAASELTPISNVITVRQGAGMSLQSLGRLTEKVIDNIRAFLNK